MKIALFFACVILPVQLATTNLDEQTNLPIIDTPLYRIVLIFITTFFSYVLFGPPASASIVLCAAVVLMLVARFSNYPGMIIKIEQYAVTVTWGALAGEYLWLTRHDV